VALALGACSRSAPPPAPPAAPAPEPRAALERLVEAYWDESAAERGELRPIDLSGLAAARALEQRYLEALLALPRPNDPEALLTYEVFRREREVALAGFTYPEELFPVNPFDSSPLRLALHAGASDALSSKQAVQWEARAREFARWADQAIVNLRAGEQRGYVLPRVLVEESLVPLAQLSTDTPDNPFNSGLRSPTPGLATAVRQTLLPAYGRLHDFLQHEYLARARSGVSLRDLPLGEAWYAHRIRRYTGQERSVADLHAFGQAEVERLQGRVQALLVETAFPGNLAGYLKALEPASEPDQLESVARYLTQGATAAEAAFGPAPRAPILRAVPVFRVSTADWLEYAPAVPGELDAVLWLNARAGAPDDPLGGGWARVLAAATPGRHLETSSRIAARTLPRFRRFGGDPAFEAGWALYAGAVGEELGLYHDTAARLGPLMAEERCALGMVIDTGLQAQGWTRAQALEYLRAHLPLDGGAAQRVVDRAIALPGEALACGVGLREIRALRAEAQQRLGARFVASEFHAALLAEGALPLDLLAMRLRRWMESAH